MSNKFCESLRRIQKKHDSLVCVGLDTSMDKIPKSLLGEKDPIFPFNKAIISTIRSIDFVES